jgi:heme-binding NEAT domain protein
VLRKWSLSRYCYANFILETKTKVGSTTGKAPTLRTNPNIDEEPTTPKPPTHPFHPQTPHPSTPSSSLGSQSFVYHASIKRGLKRRLIYEYRCGERLKTKNEESTRLTNTGLVWELEHLKTKTRLIDEKFASVRGECET